MFPVITITIDAWMVKVVKTNGNGWGSIKKHGID